MAGTLTISTLSDGTNSTSATNCIQGSAKAWVNFAGGASPTIQASYNVSSVTLNSTGQTIVNITNAFADTNGSVVCGGTYLSAWGSVGESCQGFLNSTTQVYVKTGNTSAFQNWYRVCVAVFR